MKRRKALKGGRKMNVCFSGADAPVFVFKFDQMLNVVDRSAGKVGKKEGKEKKKIE